VLGQPFALRFLPSVATTTAPGWNAIIRQLRTSHASSPPTSHGSGVGPGRFAVGPRPQSITGPVGRHLSADSGLGLQSRPASSPGTRAPDYFETAGRQGTRARFSPSATSSSPNPIAIPGRPHLSAPKVGHRGLKGRVAPTYSATRREFRGHPSHPATETDVEPKSATMVEGADSAPGPCPTPGVGLGQQVLRTRIRWPGGPRCSAGTPGPRR